MFSKLVNSEKAIYAFNILLFLLIAKNSQAQAPETPFHFEPNAQESNAFQHFDVNATGVNPINTFFLAKMSEMMYLERLDYQLRYLQNGQKPVDSLPSSDWLKANLLVNNQNFETAFRTRFNHYFYDPSSKPVFNGALASAEKTGMSSATPVAFDHCYWIDSTNWAKENIPQFHFIHKTEYWDDRKKQGLDPEVMVISTKEAVLIVFRGTDKVEKDEWSEWKGTDFRIGLVRAGGNLMGAKVHRGFWESFDLIRDELIRSLERFDGQHKKIWITGHSLGGAMAILSGAYLKSAGYPIQNVYAFAAPRVVGDAKFTKRLDQLLPNQVQRFEYYLDPITLLWAPRYRYAGQRNWFDQDQLGQYKLYCNVKERYIHFWHFHFHRHPFKDKRTKTDMRLHKDQKNGLITELPFRFWYHNPQWYVKAAYAQLTDAQKALLPAVDDSFPYLYDSAKGPMPGTK